MAMLCTSSIAARVGVRKTPILVLAHPAQMRLSAAGEVVLAVVLVVVVAVVEVEVETINDNAFSIEPSASFKTPNAAISNSTCVVRRPVALSLLLLARLAPVRTDAMSILTPRVLKVVATIGSQIRHIEALSKPSDRSLKVLKAHLPQSSSCAASCALA
jgi:hypothetical protein